MIIEFLICTIDEGIAKVPSLLLEPEAEVRYLVSWQHSGKQSVQSGLVLQTAGRVPVPPAVLLQRKDVRIVELEGSGLSRNRNHALRHATGDWLVLADDDNRYSLQSLESLRRAVALHPQAAVLQLQGRSYEGKLLHDYVSYAYEYRSRPRFTYYSSWELIVRRSALLPPFDERFGLGTYLGCGEEEVFVHDVSQCNQEIWYEPLPFVLTSPSTTGTRFAASPAVQRAKGGVLTHIHGPFGAMLRCMKYALTCTGYSFVSRCRFCIEMFKGIRYVLSHHPLP